MGDPGTFAYPEGSEPDYIGSGPYAYAEGSEPAYGPDRSPQPNHVDDHALSTKIGSGNAPVGAYTGVDVSAYIILPRTVDTQIVDKDGVPNDTLNLIDSKVINLGTIKSFSYQVFREKQPVRSLGLVYPKTFVRGTRTIAGTMIFSVIVNGVLERIMHSMRGSFGSVVAQDFPYALNDQLPPFDLFLKFNNEYGQASHMILNAVEFFTDGMVISVDNLVIEEQIRFQARGFSGLLYDGEGIVTVGGSSGTDETVWVEAQDRASKFFQNVLGSALAPNGQPVTSDRMSSEEEHKLHLQNIISQRKAFI